MASLSASHALAATPLPLVASSSSSSCRGGPVVVSAVADGASQPKLAMISRRHAAVTSLTALSVFLFSRPAHARDVPIFGLKKAKKLGDQVVQEVKDLVKEGEGAISGAVAEFPGAAGRNIPSFSGEGLSPAVQAGTVAGAGVVGVLIASTVVNSLVSTAK